MANIDDDDGCFLIFGFLSAFRLSGELERHAVCLLTGDRRSEADPRLQATYQPTVILSK